MFNIPLPPKPDFEQYKKRAKELVKVAKDRDPGAPRRWAEEWFLAVVKLLGTTTEPFFRAEFEKVLEHFVALVAAEQGKAGGLTLANAQFLVANIHGFKDWKSFGDAVRRLTHLSSDEHLFETAVDAVITGDADALRALFRDRPDLVRARSHREHRCTLLHYVAANGVEDYRQRTPANAVEIARLLLDAGAEVDALAETYGGGRGQTTMNLLVSSAHPHTAGLQSLLAEVLLDYGAKIEGLDDDGSPIQTALAFGYLDTARALHRRGARIGNITVAASLGRVDLVRDFVEGRGPELKASLARLYWSGVGKTPKDRQRVAFHWACSFGSTDVVKYFLDLGMDPADVDDNRMSLLHNACSGPHMDIVRLLLARKVPLEGKNVWGGTAINSTLHFAYEAKRWRPEWTLQFVECIEALIAAGADLREVDYVVGVPEIDAVLDRHRPRPTP
jgi:ankyrin repeat protein